MEYEKYFKWAYAVGKTIINTENVTPEKGRALLEKLIYDLRAEETPGRFLKNLSETLADYKLNKNILANISLNPEIMSKDWHADKFYYLKAAILCGLLNALSDTREETPGGEENE